MKKKSRNLKFRKKLGTKEKNIFRRFQFVLKKFLHKFNFRQLIKKYIVAKKILGVRTRL